MFHGPNAARTLIVMQITHTLGTGGVAHCTMWTWCQRAPEVKLAQFTRYFPNDNNLLYSNHEMQQNQIKITLVGYATCEAVSQTHRQGDVDSSWLAGDTHGPRRDEQRNSLSPTK